MGVSANGTASKRSALDPEQIAASLERDQIGYMGVKRDVRSQLRYFEVDLFYSEQGHVEPAIGSDASNVEDDDRAGSRIRGACGDRLDGVAWNGGAGGEHRLPVTQVQAERHLAAASHVAHLAQTFANGYDSVDGHPATSQEIRLEQAASGNEYLAASDLKDKESRDEKLGLRP